MSRGLGRLQRFIKEQIYRAERDYERECVALRGREKVRPGFDTFDQQVKSFLVYWWDVKDWVEENPDFNPDPQYRMSDALERSAKRALQSLVKRGEITRLSPRPPNRLYKYITKEMDERLHDAASGISQRIMSQP